MRKLCFYILLWAVVTPVYVSATTTEVPSRDTLRKHALVQMETLDQGLYDVAWSAMSPLFRAFHDRREWQNQQTLIRTTYGSLLSRKFIRIGFRDSYTLSPDGQYVIIQYRSDFEHKVETIETIVLDCSHPTGCTIREYIIR